MNNLLVFFVNMSAFFFCLKNSFVFLIICLRRNPVIVSIWFSDFFRWSIIWLKCVSCGFLVRCALSGVEILLLGCCVTDKYCVCFLCFGIRLETPFTHTVCMNSMFYR
uniref:Uncharacterized protein n=1 Tax=Cacopsylla melanoneura TaxID=428564 RepID=A0A8D9APG4_9HEMI